jgi:hypothetical protein
MRLPPVNILPKILLASLAWWIGSNTILTPMAAAYYSVVRSATYLPPSARILNLLTCTYLPPLNIYLDYLLAKFTIRLLFLPAG